MKLGKGDGANKDDSKKGEGLCKCILSARSVCTFEKYINKPTAGLCVNLESFSVSIPACEPQTKFYFEKRIYSTLCILFNICKF